MAISFPLLTKGLAGLAAIGAPVATGIYYRNEIKEFLNPTNSQHVEPTQTTKDLTKFDESLINFLEKEGKIVFKVSVGNDSTLSTFPAFENNTLSASIKIAVKTSTEDESEGKLEEKTGVTDAEGKIETIKNLNGNSEWTWECEIKFEKKNGSSATELKEKDTLIKTEGNKGFFNKLKERDNAKKEKIKLIKACAKNRGNGLNVNLDAQTNLSSVSSISAESSPAQENNKVKSEIIFKFEDESVETNKKLVIQNDQKKEFEDLFKSETNS